MVYEYYQYLNIDKILDSLGDIIEDLDDINQKNILKIIEENLLEIREKSNELDEVVLSLNEINKKIMNDLYTRYILVTLRFLQVKLKDVPSKLITRSYIMENITKDIKYLDNLSKTGRY